jgi:L-histidine Nalpha-methyltransferase
MSMRAHVSVPGVDARSVEEFASDVQYYLLQDPRQLPSRYFYDDLGSTLFDAICHLPWYPITRAELRLLASHGAQILERASASTILELGCGNGDKLLTLLRTNAVHAARSSVHLVDLSPAALADAVDKLSAMGLRVATHVATYEAGLHAAAGAFVRPGRALVLFLGSNIGNFDPPASNALSRGIRSELRPGDALLLGADLVKSVAAMTLAYDDPLGVTAAFNRNLLVRINRELGGDFAIDQFVHRALWNPSASRMEMHLVARSEQHVEIPACALGLTIHRDESIWTESSYKYDAAGIRDMVIGAGFVVSEQWVDQRDPFALTLASVA